MQPFMSPKVSGNSCFEKIEGEVVKKLLLEGKRLDGRGYKDVRPINCEVGICCRGPTALPCLLAARRRHL